MKIIFTLSILLVIQFCTGAEIKTKTADYKQDNKDYEGYFAEPANLNGKVPGVLLIHEWTGLGDYVKGRANQTAQLGYVSFAMDMYGKGIRVEDHDHEKAGKLSGAYSSDKTLMLSRIDKAVEVLKSHPNVDPARISIIGYCFGGRAAVEYALAGRDVKSTSSFHGVLPSATLQSAKKVKGSLELHHGADDKFTPQKDIDSLLKSLKDAGVKHEFYSYPGAVHSFTRASAGTAHKAMGMAYDAEADRLSWSRLVAYLKSTLN